MKKKKIEKKIFCNAFARGGRKCPNGHFPQYKYA